ncbi:MAG: isoprenylcysteine carboxylmethyltransferase family protein [Gemmatimonadetes bacterium]|nr:isoprenylcysteine carboxylmethyltransferase family protein [Gemmatimonadota bacterium]
MKPLASDHPHVLIFPPVLFVGTLLLGLLLDWLFPRSPFPPRPAMIAGAVLVFASGALGFWGERTMHQAGTNVKPTQPTTAVVTGGPFRFTRNPLYLSVNLLYVGITLLANAVWPLLLLIPMLVVLHYGIVLREERYLEAKFGETYLNYKRRVRRWI